VTGNEKPAILSALISSSTNAWTNFHKYPLKKNMRLTHAATALATGELVTPDEQAQLDYIDAN